MARDTTGRWVVDDDTVWWEFGAGEAMEPEEALRNHVDNQQFNAAYDDLMGLIRAAGVAAGPQTTPPTLQERAGAWHRCRFPDADQTLVTLKAMEELGEVAEAVSDAVGRNSTDRTKGLSVPIEAADVVIALMVLLERWFPEADLLGETDRKLSLLEDINSGHRSAARVVAAPTSQEDDHGD